MSLESPWRKWFAWRPVRLSELRGPYYVQTGRWAWWRHVRRTYECYPIYAELPLPRMPWEPYERDTDKYTWEIA